MHRRFAAWLAVAAAIAVTLFGQCCGQEVRATIAARVLQEAYYNNVTGKSFFFFFLRSYLPHTVANA